jgi:hypothetical protein
LCAFCQEAALPYLPASPEVGLLWALHIAKKGTVQADTAGGCFSGVNTVHELLRHPKPCTGFMFDSFKRGWVNAQVMVADVEDSTRVLACPASVAFLWYQALECISEDSQWLLPFAVLLPVVRSGCSYAQPPYCPWWMQRC